jgi:hypothetical protein
MGKDRGVTISLSFPSSLGVLLDGPPPHSLSSLREMVRRAMNLRHGLYSAVAGFVALSPFHSSAQAGTNDLFRANVVFRCSGPNTKLRLANGKLINLALGNALEASVPSNLKLGLQCDCSTRQMDLVIYDTSTTETVATLADFTTVAYRTKGKTAVVIGSGSVPSSGSVLGGQLTARMIVHLDSDACARRTRISARDGTLELDTPDGVISLNLRRGTLRTFGPQLRPEPMTGSGNCGLSVSNAGVIVGGSVGSGGVLVIGGDGGVTTNLNGFGGTIFPGGGLLISSSPNLQNLDVGTNSVVTFSTTQLQTGATCGVSLNIGTNQNLSLDPILCANTTISLSSGSVLNVCTNGLADDVLTALLGAVSGEGTLSLTNCAPSTSP